jgi:type IV fimbrial biogenesis protein FimT
MGRVPGFTLLELMVVLALVSLLLMAGVPAYRTFVLNLELRAATERLASDLRYARHAAVNEGDRVGVCPGDDSAGCLGSPVWDEGWIIYGDENGDRTWQAAEPLLRVSPRLRGMSARSSSGRTELGFFPNGTAPGSNATVRLCDERGGAFGRQVRISLTGRIRTTHAPRDGDAGC